MQDDQTVVLVSGSEPGWYQVAVPDVRNYMFSSAGVPSVSFAEQQQQ